MAKQKKKKLVSGVLEILNKFPNDIYSCENIIEKETNQAVKSKLNMIKFLISISPNRVYDLESFKKTIKQNIKQSDMDAQLAYVPGLFI